MLKSLFNGKQIVILLLVTLSSRSAFIQAMEKRSTTLDILIIYSTGNPYDWNSLEDIAKGIETEIKDIDAITTPTPLTENCGNIAEQLAASLSKKKLIVRVAETMEIKHRDEILQARMVVIGSPAYFGNVSWQIKKLFDEQFHKIYLLEKGRLSQKRIAAFSMAEVNGSARSALQAIRSVVIDCKGRFGPTMIFLTKDSKTEINNRVEEFSAQLADLVDRN
jgi:hypothetical protein